MSATQYSSSRWWAPSTRHFNHGHLQPISSSIDPIFNKFLEAVGTRMVFCPLSSPALTANSNTHQPPKPPNINNHDARC
eukprot:scaffold26151_cov36-Cyclotella_meneghiniana.AAC.1